VDDGEIVISSAHPDRPLRFTRRETSVREMLEEEVSRMQAEDQVRPEGVPPQDVEVPVRPEGTAAADVSVVSKPFRSVAREILRSVHRRAAGAGGKGDRRWHQVIKSTTMPVKDLAALAAQNPGIVFLGEFDKNTVLKARLRVCWPWLLAGSCELSNSCTKREHAGASFYYIKKIHAGWPRTEFSKNAHTSHLFTTSVKLHTDQCTHHRP
jgi:hypothetical protein